ncbi:MAG: alpha/beta hydrolase [Acidiferrobacterales bacterium]
MSGLFRGYDRAGLDAQYNNRAAVPEHVEIVERWRQDGVRATTEHTHHLDLAYGASPLEKLDVFPASGGESAPVHVFFHGGFWMSRDKSDFRFLARTFVPRGMAFVSVNYGLLPDIDMDQLVRQCRAALDWVYSHIREYGGNPDRVFVSGHSAGGHIVAMLMATDWVKFAGLPQDIVKGGCAISGVYDLEPVRLCYINDTIDLTPDQAARNSPMGLTPPSKAPFIVAFGGAESDEFQRQSIEFVGMWNQKGARCQVMKRPDLNHYTIIEEFADPNSSLTRTFVSQMG